MRWTVKSRESTAKGILVCLTSIQMFGLLWQTGATEIGPTSLGSTTTRPCTSGGGNSSLPIFSGDGRSVVFLSEAKNLVTNADSTTYLEVFARDLGSGKTTLVSVNASGMGGANGNCSQPSVSSNGQIVAFVNS